MAIMMCFTNTLLHIAMFGMIFLESVFCLQMHNFHCIVSESTFGSILFLTPQNCFRF